MDASDADLIQAYLAGSQEAFAALVRRHLDLVYSAARRQTQSAALAEDVTQAVFLKLSRHAGQLQPGTPLPAWLYTTTRHAAIDLLRQESRRRAREHTASEIHAMHTAPSPWSQVEPLLDEAMASLPDPDRDALLHRYFANKSLRDVGAALGITDDAAQKRVSRALDQLRTLLAKRGVAFTAAGLATDLSAHAIETAPTALSATISAGAFTTAAAIATTTSAITMSTSSKLAFSAVLALSIGAALSEGIYISVQSTRIAELERNVQRLASRPPVPARAPEPTPAPAPVETPASVVEVPTVMPNPVPMMAEAAPQGPTLEEILQEKSEARALDLYLERLKGLADGDIGAEFTKLLALRRAAKGTIGFDDPENFRTGRTGSIYGDPFVHLLLTTWGERAPKAALGFVLDPASPEQNTGFTYRYADVILAGWSHVDPPAAWNGSLDLSRDKARETGSFAAAFAGLRIAAVGDELVKHGQFSDAATRIAAWDEYSGIFAKPLVTAWAREDFAAAAAWVNELPSSPLRSDQTYADAKANALSGLAEATARQDLNAVRQQIQQADQPNHKNSMAAGVMNTIESGVKPLVALGWLVAVLNENSDDYFGAAYANYASLTRTRIKSGSAEVAEETALVATVVNPKQRAELEAAISKRAKLAP